MIVLDTNVVSELLRARPDPAVVGWLDAQPWDRCVVTAVTAAELRAGVAVLPAGRRRSQLHDEIEQLLQVTFRERVIPFDDAASLRYADIVGERKGLGRPIGFADSQIAAIARSRRARLATGNTADFTDTGVDLIDPWTAGT